MTVSLAAAGADVDSGIHRHASRGGSACTAAGGAAAGGGGSDCSMATAPAAMQAAATEASARFEVRAAPIDPLLYGDP